MRVVLVASFAAMACLPARAQDTDARRGLAFATQTCAECHGVRAGERSRNPAAPAFEVVAGVPGMTALALQAALQTSHREMPNLILQANERADVIAYILSLAPKSR
jgi:mono/diheme cytochrome c family protein